MLQQRPNAAPSSAGARRPPAPAPPRSRRCCEQKQLLRVCEGWGLWRLLWILTLVTCKLCERGTSLTPSELPAEAGPAVECGVTRGDVCFGSCGVPGWVTGSLTHHQFPFGHLPSSTWSSLSFQANALFLVCDPYGALLRSCCTQTLCREFK